MMPCACLGLCSQDIRQPFQFYCDLAPAGRAKIAFNRRTSVAN
jgi:hypothetical protein